MSDRFTTRPLGEAAFEAAASAMADHAYTQLPGYSAAVARRDGARVEHLALESAGEELGVAALRIKSVPLIAAGLSYVHGGPLTRRGAEPDLERIECCLLALRDQHAVPRSQVLRVRLPTVEASWLEPLREMASRLGFAHLAEERQYSTLLLDLERDEDEIRRGLGKRWRRGLNQSQRAELELEVGTSPELFAAFNDVYSTMIERKQFSTALDASFYAELQQQLPESARFVVMLARKGTEVAAGVVLSFLGDTGVFVLGASNDLGRDTRASYLLHWRAAMEARERGLRVYDLGGIDREANPGVATFKEGIGNIEALGPGPFEFVPSTARARLVGSLVKVRQRVRRG